jgi:hypothetical protein
MNITLEKYLDRINEINNNYKQINFINLTEVDSNINELNTMLKLLNKLFDNIQITKNKLNKYKNNDIINLSYNKNNLFLNKELISTDNNNIIYIDDITEIPITPIYWIHSIKQFGINLGGMILRGNIGNIYNKNIILKNNNLSNIMYCNKQNKCINILNQKYCKFYHDPLDLIILKNNGTITEEFYNKQILPRNFINTSWIYTDYPEKKNNSNMRLFGSVDTLEHFIKLSKLIDEDINKKNYMDQTMHDILVLYLLYINNL